MIHQKSNSKSERYQAVLYRDRTWEYHFHNSYELIYVFDGSMTVEANGNAIDLQKDDFLLISPCMAHAIPQSAGCHFFIAIFSADFVPDVEYPMDADVYHFHVSEETKNYLRTYFLLEQTPPRYMLKSCLYALFAHALTHYERQPAHERRHHSFVYAVNRYIAEHFTRDFRRADIAAALNYEEHYFSELFGKSFRMGLKKYVNLYRLSHAKTLLSTTDHSITQIAAESGFSSVRRFNAVFLALTGETPREYRNKTKNGL